MPFNYQGYEFTSQHTLMSLKQCSRDSFSTNSSELLNFDTEVDFDIFFGNIFSNLSSQLQKLFFFRNENSLRVLIFRLLKMNGSTISKLSIYLFSKVIHLVTRYFKMFTNREHGKKVKDLEINSLIELFYKFCFKFFETRKMVFKGGISLMVFRDPACIFETISWLKESVSVIKKLAFLNNEAKKNSLRKNIEKIYQTMKNKNNLKRNATMMFLDNTKEYFTRHENDHGLFDRTVKPSGQYLVHHQEFLLRPMFDFYGKIFLFAYDLFYLCYFVCLV